MKKNVKTKQLIPATVRDADGNLSILCVPGDKIVIERYTTIMSKSKLMNSKLYTVNQVNVDTKSITCMDECSHVCTISYEEPNKVFFAKKVTLKK